MECEIGRPRLPAGFACVHRREYRRQRLPCKNSRKFRPHRENVEALAEARPQARLLETGDIDDPKPWLEAYEAGVGSPLELKFLRLFERHGLAVDKQVEVSPSDDALPISTADFVVTGKRIAIYIDSAAFHVGRALSRDRFLRDRLRNGSPAWKVVELRAQDLQKGEDLVREIQGVV